MAMVIANNNATMLTLGELNKNISRIGKDLKKVSSGMKIVSAGDDAANFAISERMRVQICGLGQDQANTKNGASMLRIAEGGIQSIISELRTMKELALNAANDHNTDLDRATIQKEIDQRLAIIDDTVATTNYNGKILLDGTYKAPVTQNTVSGSAAVVDDVIVIESGDYTITADGIYQFAAGYQGTLTINASNVELRQTDAAPLDGVHIVGNMAGGLKLWLNDIHISNTQTTGNINDLTPNNFGSVGSVIRFEGSDNKLLLIGDNTIHRGATVLTVSRADTLLDIGNGLTIQDGTGNGSGSLAVTGKSVTPIGSRGGINMPDADLTINSGHITANALNDPYDVPYAAIGVGSQAYYGNSMGNITIHGGTVVAVGDRGAGIGCCGKVGIVGEPTVGIITINSHASITAVSNYGEGIGHGYDYATATPTAGIVGGIVYTDEAFEEPLEERMMVRTSGNPLVFQTGTKANQQIHCYINGMHTWDMGIEDLQLTTRDFASAAIDKIDKAITYALNENTRVGAYISRLGFTEDNLVMAQENVTASESTIRDADMAKEMAAYTKDNVLAQAAQSMLAQANQNASSVLSLLQ